MVSTKRIDRTAPGDKAVRQMLSALLDWEDAHVGFEKAVAGVPPELRGVRPPGAPHSLWEIVEHLRLAQADILEFCVSSKDKEKTWPAGYWPATPSPPSKSAWDDSIARFQRDRRALQKLAADPKIDLSEKIPHGSGQTYLRELVLVADHTAYHVGQLVLVRQLLGIWKA